MEATREAGKDSVVLNALAEGVPEREMGAVGGVMLHFGGCFVHQTAASTPMAPLPEEQMRAHVGDVHGNPLAVPEALVPNGKASSASPPEEDHRRGRPELPADDGGCGGGGVVPGDAAAVAPGPPPEEEEVCGRERLKRHRVAMAGRVWIPESWGQEQLLTDWIDCEAIDRALVPSGLLLAREALVEECRRANSGRFRIENRCLST